MNSMLSRGASVRLLGVSAKFCTGFWYVTAVASSKPSVVILFTPDLLSARRNLLRNTGPYSAIAKALRQNGCVAAHCGVEPIPQSENFAFSLARSASAPTKFGYILSHPRGSVQPWTITCMWCLLAISKSSQYFAMTNCLSPPQKSTLTPRTPFDASHAISFSVDSRVLNLFFGVCGAAFQSPFELYHR